MNHCRVRRAHQRENASSWFMVRTAHPTIAKHEDRDTVSESGSRYQHVHLLPELPDDFQVDDPPSFHCRWIYPLWGVPAGVPCRRLSF